MKLRLRIGLVPRLMLFSLAVALLGIAPRPHAYRQALEQARQQIRIAESQVESDQIDLDLARQRLVDTRVLSPMDGTVLLATTDSPLSTSTVT